MTCRYVFNTNFFPKLRHIILQSRRFNFVSSADFSPTTQNSYFSDKKLFLLEDGSHITYNDFNQRSGQFAYLLHSKYGIQRGDKILCRVSKSTDSAALYFAVLRLGAVYIPLNPSYTKAETAHFITDAEPKVFITAEGNSDIAFKDSVNQILNESVLENEAKKCSPMLDVENVHDDEIACILYTSGTTGKPKGAMISHGALKSNAAVLVDYWKFEPNDINLHALPFYHIHGLLVSFHCTIFSKSSTIFLPKFTVPSSINFLPKTTVFMGVPTYYARLVESKDLSSKLVKNVRLFISGSATLLSGLFEEFRMKTGKRICERYGMTETLVSTSNPVDNEQGRLPGSAGHAIPGVEIRISSSGVVEVKSPALFSGYLNLPDKTKQEFTDDGYFITGDMGEIDQNGYLWIQGRQKDLIISGGLNVYPMEIEKLLDSMDEIMESAVIGVPHSDFGEGVIAICELNNSKSSRDQDALSRSISEELRSILAPYKRPKKIIFVDQFPRNHLGKIQKNLLRQRYNGIFAQK